METLAYLHLALANEEPADTELNWENLKFLDWLDRHHLSTTAAISLLSLTVALGIVGRPTQASALVKQGDRGSEVTALQERLKELGYFQANVTGFFGPLTKDAVTRFQQAMGLLPDGVAGNSTQTSLNNRRVQSRSLPVSTRDASQRLWRVGDRGEQVTLIQESLAVSGFAAGTNGIFDSETQEAVRQFQQARGLAVDGIVGSQTMAALPAVGGENSTPVRANSANRYNVQALQRRLREQGFYRGPIDGVWGSQTQAALEAAQRAYSVSTTDLANGGY
ncbi:MAG TPA: peptidoglycan-binding protein [Chroococcales cyanobacterium]